MRPPSFTNRMQGDLSPMRRPSMLEQVNALPSPQGELPLHDRNRKLHTGQGRADMGGHVVGTFVGVPISAVVLRRHAVEKCLEIGANVPPGVLLNEQSREVGRQNHVKNPVWTICCFTPFTTSPPTYT